MQGLKDAAIVLVLILLAATIRVTPPEAVADLVPEAQAAALLPTAAAENAPVLRPSSRTGEQEVLVPVQRIRLSAPPPMGTAQPNEAGENCDACERVRIRIKRDRPSQAVACETAC